VSCSCEFCLGPPTRRSWCRCAARGARRCDGRRPAPQRSRGSSGRVRAVPAPRPRGRSGPRASRPARSARGGLPPRPPRGRSQGGGAPQQPPPTGRKRPRPGHVPGGGDGPGSWPGTRRQPRGRTPRGVAATQTRRGGSRCRRGARGARPRSGLAGRVPGLRRGCARCGRRGAGSAPSRCVSAPRPCPTHRWRPPSSRGRAAARLGGGRRRHGRVGPARSPPPRRVRRPRTSDPPGRGS